MKSEIHIVDRAECCYIDIEGTIGVPEEWQFENPEERVATYEKFRDTLQRIAEIRSDNVVVNIRSTGGDVNDALLIHDALCALDAHITTRCYGYTASAATIIAQAASEGCREISPNALYLIHSSICSVEGNSAELESCLDLLRQTDARIAGVYADRSGHAVEEFETLMAENSGRGRWLSPEETIAAGLADRVVDAKSAATESAVTEPDPEPAVTTDAKKPANRLSGWRRLLADIGFRRFADRANSETESPASRPEGSCNVLHWERDRTEALRRSLIEAEEKRRQYGPTELLSREDPSYGEPVRSANERAYAADLKAFL